MSRRKLSRATFFAVAGVRASKKNLVALNVLVITAKLADRIGSDHESIGIIVDEVHPGSVRFFVLDEMGVVHNPREIDVQDGVRLEHVRNDLRNGRHLDASNDSGMAPDESRFRMLV